MTQIDLHRVVGGRHLQKVIHGHQRGDIRPLLQHVDGGIPIPTVTVTVIQDKSIWAEQIAWCGSEEDRVEHVNGTVTTIGLNANLRYVNCEETIKQLRTVDESDAKNRGI